MAIALTNAVLLDLDPLRVRRGTVRVEHRVIAAAGAGVRPRAGDEVVDCGGALVMPGLVNGHAHLYSALAVGMPPPKRAPVDFPQILDRVWWRLDRALTPESIEMSALIGALDALHCGTTTLIDHHASPNGIAGSLDLLERGIDAVGLRGVLCYEVTDRNGPAGTAAGLEENRRYLEKRRNAETPKRRNLETPKRRESVESKRSEAAFSRDPQGSALGRDGDAAGENTSHAAGRFAGMVGAHAAFTLSDESLRACVQLAAEFKTGVHIHVAEDPCDDHLCRQHYGAPLIARLRKSGLLSVGSSVAARSILAHGTHLARPDARRASERVAAMAHNPRSNMNNAVGYAPVAHMRNVLLGTDGIGNDMFTEARCAWFKVRDAAAVSRGFGPRGPGMNLSPESVAPASRRWTRAGISPAEVVAMMAHGARVASSFLGGPLGRLASRAAADLVVTDYLPATPLDGDNAAGHLIFSLGPQHVRHVMVGGAWALRDRRAVLLDEREVRSRAIEVTRALWSRLRAL